MTTFISVCETPSSFQGFVEILVRFLIYKSLIWNTRLGPVLFWEVRVRERERAVSQGGNVPLRREIKTPRKVLHLYLNSGWLSSCYLYAPCQRTNLLSFFSAQYINYRHSKIIMKKELQNKKNTFVSQCLPQYVITLTQKLFSSL